MRLSYFDGSGAEIPAAGGADDTDSIRGRAAIRRIRIELVGISRTRNVREFHLETEISPRNADLAGLGGTKSVPAS